MGSSQYELNVSRAEGRPRPPGVVPLRLSMTNMVIGVCHMYMWRGSYDIRK